MTAKTEKVSCFLYIFFRNIKIQAKHIKYAGNDIKEHVLIQNAGNGGLLKIINYHQQ